MLSTARRAAGLGVLLAAGLFLLAPASTVGQGGKFALKVIKSPPPKDLKEPIAKLLAPEAIQFADNGGNLIAEIWLRQDVPADATAEQIKNGLTYREFKETAILGAIRFGQAWSDYRKQKIKPGVYTLRLGFQPEDGDHAGSSLFKEFVLLVAAKADAKPDLLDPKDLYALSAKSIETGHPAALMLFPLGKAPAQPKLEAKTEGFNNPHHVLFARESVKANGTKVEVGIGLNLVGHAE
jgi:hypothetical protein